MVGDVVPIVVIKVCRHLVGAENTAPGDVAGVRQTGGGQQFGAGGGADAVGADEQVAAGQPAGCGAYGDGAGVLGESDDFLTEVVGIAAEVGEQGVVDGVVGAKAVGHWRPTDRGTGVVEIAQVTGFDA